MNFLRTHQRCLFDNKHLFNMIRKSANQNKPLILQNRYLSVKKNISPKDIYFKKIDIEKLLTKVALSGGVFFSITSGYHVFESEGLIENSYTKTSFLIGLHATLGFCLGTFITIPLIITSPCLIYVSIKEKSNSIVSEK